ncbi:YbaK/EbsC family protein [Fructobacillus fructosus]|uniref:YbaK-like aminoacyl-tRNA editing domain (ProX) n=1 Tax=Fructobacillus fructosus TaxID=1631 RepID=A0ABN9YVH0_9LACO|nr:YbaK/EbsC family protein [Fructobacillus fructosus]MBD9364898.1 prolyl-tRNA editing protein [Leuconostoc mesenteroides]KRN51839.1 YbaK prolyl-tRNA synthetase associated region [Fructobacillus fructosus KCTC 3544]MBC9118421.1 prolyl-tRNA editing protein [Fructobacillus fructosus]MCK8638728.1 prolyl-tRNA editing protein [Fructobacillus fructosus]CAK1248559.1 Predicted aminoacyl-tRNA deacylase [Fructobacillus fructosus]
MNEATEREALTLLEKSGALYKRYTHPTLHHLNDTTAPKEFLPMKNLLIRTKKTAQFYLYMTMQERIDFGRLAKALGSTKSQLRFASEEELFDLMAVHPGTVTPLALEKDKDKKIHLVIDQAIIDADQVAVHPNQNEATVVMTWAEFTKVLDELGEEYQVLTDSPAV